MEGFSERKMFDRLQSERVFLLQDTGVKNAAQGEWRTRFPNHQLYFSKEDGHGLVIGIIGTMKSQYKFQLSHQRQGQLLFVDAELDGPGLPMTTLICAYFRPRCTRLASFTYWLRRKILEGRLCRKVLFAGDLNAKFGNLMCTVSGELSQNATVDSAGQFLAEFFTAQGFRMINGNVPGDIGLNITFPKRKNMSEGSRVDYVLVSGCVKNVVSLAFSHWMGSDHVTLKVSWNPSQTPKLMPAILGVQYTTYCG